MSSIDILASCFPWDTGKGPYGLSTSAELQKLMLQWCNHFIVSCKSVCPFCQQLSGPSKFETKVRHTSQAPSSITVEAVPGPHGPVQAGLSEGDVPLFWLVHNRFCGFKFLTLFLLIVIMLARQSSVASTSGRVAGPAAQPSRPLFAAGSRKLVVSMEAVAQGTAQASTSTPASIKFRPCIDIHKVAGIG